MKALATLVAVVILGACGCANSTGGLETPGVLSTSAAAATWPPKVPVQSLGTEFFVKVTDGLGANPPGPGVLGITVARTNSPVTRQDFAAPIDLSAVRAFDVAVRQFAGHPPVELAHLRAVTDRSTVLSPQAWVGGAASTGELLDPGDSRSATMAFVVPAGEHLTRIVFMLDDGVTDTSPSWAVD
ncbi:hypothetical protein OG225_07200 [Nocardia sp. NBC_01377]|uniref:hypothetical protein n=1 Tax=Nocardia sp. NBC_01377 TaxID=2903595 RepID=UPI003246E0BC